MAMTNEKGDTVSGWKEIADVFATFYEVLYNTRRTEHTGEGWSDMGCEQIAAVTAVEVRTCSKKIAKKKAKDHHGIVVEMLQQAGNI